MKKKKKKGGASKKTKEEPKDEAKGDSKEEAKEEPKEETPAETPAETTKEAPAESTEADDKAIEDDKNDDASPPSLAQQSKLRSTSFRAGASPGSPGPLSPDGGDTAPDIYRKHVARIEELEKEIKKLSKDNEDSEKRWKKAEDELADLREAEGGASKGDDDTEKLVRTVSSSKESKLTSSQKSEIASLQRQNTQLQSQVSKGGHGHRSSVSVASPPADLQAELESKSSTIETMEIEISKLKARVERQESGAETEKEQVTALEEKLARAEAAAGKAQRELQDLKRNLERTSEKAVKEGSERSSAETKVRSLEQELGEIRLSKGEAEKKVEALEKKVTTLTTLHKEQDSRSQALKKEKEALDTEVKKLKTQVEKLESENTKLKSRKSTEGGGGLDDEGVDELENEERLKLERKIRSLESEIHELRSGQWIGKRRELEATSPGFQDVDLSGNNQGGVGHKKASHGGGIGDFFTSGLNALAGTDDQLLEDDDMDFDEDAFRQAQEEESKRRLERIKEIKRSLKHWEGWRLDIVDVRRGGGEGIGEIFEI